MNPSLLVAFICELVRAAVLIQKQSYTRSIPWEDNASVRVNTLLRLYLLPYLIQNFISINRTLYPEPFTQATMKLDVLVVRYGNRKPIGDDIGRR